MVLVIATALISLHAVPSQRIERLVALARLDAAVHYFNPSVALKSARWDSLFAARAARIADAPTSATYGRLVAALMTDLHDERPVTVSPQRALEYYGAPPSWTPGVGKRGLRWRSAGAGETYRVDMGENVHVDVRLSEVSSDTSGFVERPTVASTPQSLMPSYPSVGYRLLAAARLWSTIRLFYPYKSLIDENWDDQLRAALPVVEGARDSLDYAKAVAAFAAHIPDAHVTIGSYALWAYMGAAPIGAAARFIENRLVITRISDTSAATAGLRLGDVVISVDGEAIERRIARLTPFIPAGTPQSLRFRLQSVILRGPAATPARLVVRDASGRDRSLLVPRAYGYGFALQKHRTGDAIRLLPGNVGYLDLERLTREMVDSAFRVLAKTRAIVLDDRGYPLLTAGRLAMHLISNGGGTTAAKFQRLVVRSPDTSRTTTIEEEQLTPRSVGRPTYAGRTVLLIDERAISQAEHTGLILEAANGTMFVGSPTMGANGTLEVLPLPGSYINVSFTGEGVRHGDGRQLQRVGLQPHVEVTPTIAGIRAGRDEVLEAAILLLGGSIEAAVNTTEPTRPPSKRRN